VELLVAFVLLAVSFVVILAGAEFFTDGMDAGALASL